MAQYINTNIASLNAQRNLSVSTEGLNKSMERLSSGLRINSAADDAAGLAIASKMTGEIKGLDQSKRNANDAISFVQTAESAINEQINILQRMRELSVEAANATLTSEDRSKIDNEIRALADEADRISNTSSFNGIKVMDGKGDASTIGLNFQVGAEAGQVINVKTGDLTVKGMGLTSIEEVPSNASTADITNPEQAETFYLEIDDDGDGVSDYVSKSIRIPAATGRTPEEKAEAIVAEVNKSTSATGVLAQIERFDNAGTMQYGVRLQTAEGDVVTITSDGAGTAFGAPGDLGMQAAVSSNKPLVISTTTQELASSAIVQIDKALDNTLRYRSNMGTYQNRLEKTISNLSSQSQNLQAARGRIQDTDFASETAVLTKGQIMIQSGTAMLSQANQIPKNVLSLLK